LAAVGQSERGVRSELEEAVGVFQRWLYLPDLTPLLVMFAAVAANLRDGSPVWVLFIGPPGSGKSEALNSLVGLEYVFPAATLTEASLLSGAPRKEWAKGAKGGLLCEIGAGPGIILTKDFGSVQNMNREARAAVLAALREIYDGSWTRYVGNEGGRALPWHGKVGFVGACTEKIDALHSVMAAMGERFVLVRLPDTDGLEQGRRALLHVGREPAMRAELAAAAHALMDWVESRLAKVSTEIDDELSDHLLTLADFVVKARSDVERDNRSREIENVPGSEAPGRLLLVLANLLGGMRAIGMDDEEARAALVKIGLDSIPRLRLRLLELLGDNPAGLTDGTAGEKLALPRTTVRRALQDLTVHKVIRSYGSGNGTTWQLTPWAIERMSALGLIPEMSEPTIPEMSEAPLTLLQT
jgi:hypothetical protein